MDPEMQTVDMDAEQPSQVVKPAVVIISDTKDSTTTPKSIRRCWIAIGIFAVIFIVVVCVLHMI
jgi:hypothetical protein